VKAVRGIPHRGRDRAFFFSSRESGTLNWVPNP